MSRRHRACCGHSPVDLPGSACHTRRGGAHLPDEAIHPAGAFRHVVATLGSIKDAAASLVAAHLYQQLNGPNGLDQKRTAAALHHTVATLRAQHLTDPTGPLRPRRPLTTAAHPRGRGDVGDRTLSPAVGCAVAPWAAGVTRTGGPALSPVPATPSAAAGAGCDPTERPVGPLA